MIELDGVSKSYGSTTALQPVDLRFRPGETAVLIGPSGCGKSTLLRLLIGLIEPSQGQVRFGGQPLRRESLRQVRRRVGYVVQGGGLFPHLSARANVTLLARHLGWPPARRRERVEQLRELVRLPPETLARFPHELSGGQRQRIALMRALMLAPEVLLLDEPLGALDPLVRAELQDELARIFDALGLLVVMVTHDMAEAAHFAGRIILLEDGRVVQDGALDDLVEAPAEPFVGQFLSAQRALRF